ncbi:acyltransferase [Amycolatopsis acidicola]|uniref:acyltransferase n=1 Tax=Amycolatopsis acidicola TaxID=2596893 RepID=UPI001409D914|nr:acyltransferase [Amycolatopsis acidicola]
MSGGREHLYYVDLVRVLTVGLVIGMHVLALAPVAPTAGIGALIIVFHVSREVFFVLTAFVLTYSTKGKKMRWPKFWRRRYLFVVVPYVTWTVLYFFANGGPYLGENFVQQLLTGTARYHLYFLLVSMQIYLIYPLLRAFLKATQKHHGLLLGFGVCFQLLFSLAVQRNWAFGPLAGWVHAPDALLPSYLGYILAGGIAAWHRERLVAWTRAHVGVAFGACAAAIGLGIGVYLLQVYVQGLDPLAASIVFEPVVVVESFGVVWAFLAAGLLWAERGRPGEKLIRGGSDASFGIYLVHPLLLQGTLLVLTWAGLVDYAQTVPNALVLTVLVLVLLPVLYLASGLVTAAARHTPFSLALSGRAWARPVRRTATAESREELALVNSGGAR